MIITQFPSVMQLAAVAALCVQYESEFRPNMSIVVKALQPLLKPPAPAPVPESWVCWILSLFIQSLVCILVWKGGILWYFAFVLCLDWSNKRCIAFAVLLTFPWGIIWIFGLIWSLDYILTPLFKVNLILFRHLQSQTQWLTSCEQRMLWFWFYGLKCVFHDKESIYVLICYLNCITIEHYDTIVLAGER